MIYPRRSENIKVCPECGTNLIHTAKHCAVCGYRYTDVAPLTVKEADSTSQQRRLKPVTINLPVLLGLIILVLAINSLVILGLQKRGQTKILVAAAQTTATYIATTYVSPTPSPTSTRTPPPPTETPVVDLEYTVAEGESCLSIAKKFNLYLDSLLKKNDIDCATLQVGTVLRIPYPTPTPEVTSEATNTPAP